MTSAKPRSEQFREFFADVYHEDATTLVDEWSSTPSDQSLRIDWQDLAGFSEGLAEKTLSHPTTAAAAAKSALKEDYATELLRTDVRFRNLPDRATYRVGDLREQHLRTLVAVQGEVVEVENVEPLLTRGAFECERCGTLMEVNQSYGDIREPYECPACEGKDIHWRLNMSESNLVDFQCVIVTPLESTVDDPPAMPVYLTGDIVNTVGKEDEVTVVARYQLLPMDLQRETRLNVFLEASDIDVDQYAEADSVTASELDTMIDEAVDHEMDASSSSFGADQTSVVSRVVDEHGVRRKEVLDRIEARSESSELSVHAGRITRYD